MVAVKKEINIDWKDIEPFLSVFLDKEYTNEDNYIRNLNILSKEDILKMSKRNKDILFNWGYKELLRVKGIKEDEVTDVDYYKYLNEMVNIYVTSLMYIINGIFTVSYIEIIPPLLIDKITDDYKEQFFLLSKPEDRKLFLDGLRGTYLYYLITNSGSDEDLFNYIYSEEDYIENNLYNSVHKLTDTSDEYIQNYIMVKDEDNIKYISEKCKELCLKKHIYITEKELYGIILEVYNSNVYEVDNLYHIISKVLSKIS